MADEQPPTLTFEVYDNIRTELSNDELIARLRSGEDNVTDRPIQSPPAGERVLRSLPGPQTEEQSNQFQLPE
jgi:hypothetical protein